MKSIKEISKDIIIAGLGTVDEQNEDIKDILRRGQEVLGMGHVENEELSWNGNRDAKPKEEEENEPKVRGVEISFEKTKEVRL